MYGDRGKREAETEALEAFQMISAGKQLWQRFRHISTISRSDSNQAMKLAIKIIFFMMISVLIMIIAAFIYFTCFFKDPEYIDDHSAHFSDVTIQPSEAIAIAEPYLAEHGTVVYRKDIPLTLHLLRLGDWFYVMKTNYPAKTIRYYMQPAVKVHVHTGKIEFSTR